MLGRLNKTTGPQKEVDQVLDFVSEVNTTDMAPEKGEPYVRNQDNLYNDDLVEQGGSGEKLTGDQLQQLNDNIDEITYVDQDSVIHPEIAAIDQRIATNANGNMFASWGTGMQPADGQGYQSPSEKRKAWESRLDQTNNMDQERAGSDAYEVMSQISKAPTTVINREYGMLEAAIQEQIIARQRFENQIQKLQ